MIPIAFDPIYVLPLPERHRFPMEKYDLLPKQLIHEGTCDETDFFSPSPATDLVVKAIHEPEYVDRLKAMDLSASEIRKNGFPISNQLVDREFIIAGGTIEGCLKAYDTGIAFNLRGPLGGPIAIMAKPNVPRRASDHRMPAREIAVYSASGKSLCVKGMEPPKSLKWRIAFLLSQCMVRKTTLLRKKKVIWTLHLKIKQQMILF